MKVKEINASSRRTRKAIKEAFAKLLKEKRSIENITITELVKVANITRGSFYTHFDNIYDVARDFQEELLEVIFNDEFQVTSLDNMEEYLDMVIEHLRTNEETYKMILVSNESLIFMDKLNRMMSEHLEEFFKKRDDKKIFLKITLFVNGMIVLFIKYFREEIDTSLDDLKVFIKETFTELFF